MDTQGPSIATDVSQMLSVSLPCHPSVALIISLTFIEYLLCSGLWCDG